MNPDIPIVVIAYNRPNALARLLESLSAAQYDQKVKLYISLDGIREEAGVERKHAIENRVRIGEVEKIAREFNWPFGEKILIHHPSNLGLREHVLRCGDLVTDHDAIIALEDDLLVSPSFYHYAREAFLFYQGDHEIAGISLYHHAYNETAQFPFMPLHDGSDVYFLQYASSWGQVWSREQWSGFRAWYDQRIASKQSQRAGLPPNIELWPENSWKKFFIEYVIEKGSFFVFPRTSMTTIFSDEGTNIRIRETFLQVPLCYGRTSFEFRALKDSMAVYDTYCEILPDRLKRIMKDLVDEDFDVDLYGMKPNGALRHAKVISGRACKSPERSFGREMKPQEENLIRGIPGDYFSLGPVGLFHDVPYLVRLLKCHEKKELAYWYPIREYHFYQKRILARDSNLNPLYDPPFLVRKFSATFKYALRYFHVKK